MKKHNKSNGKLLQSALDRKKEHFKIGTIAMVIPSTDNFIHAIILRDPADTLDDSLMATAYFNNYQLGDGKAPILLAACAIPVTNLLNTKTEPLESYIGMQVKVRLVGDIARDATVLPKPFLKYEEQVELKRLIESGLGLNLNSKEFNDKLIQALGIPLSYLVPFELDENPPVIIIPKEHVTTDQITQNDNDKKLKREVLKENGAIPSNKLLANLKKALCHTPAKFLSGK